MIEVCESCNRQVVPEAGRCVCPDCGAERPKGHTLPKLAVLVALLGLILAGPASARGYGHVGTSSAKRDIAGVIGLDPKTGHVSNETESAWKFELGSSVLYTTKRQRIKLAISPTFWRSGKWKAATDLGENIVGLSINRDVIPVIRIALGVGVARDLDTHDWTLYLKGSFRTW